MENNMKEPFTGNKCPRCRSGRTVNIIYGNPTKETEDLAMKGEIELGYTKTFQSPTVFCTRCGNRFK